jgi:cytochrome c oxidase subunit 3
LIISSFFWGRDINREGAVRGAHNIEAVGGFKIGIIFFIISECFFFLGIFWCYLHLAEAPAVELGGQWPPVGVSPFDPKGIPFLNTVILVSSGISVTWAHHSIELGEFKNSMHSLFYTVILGSIFSSLQLIEYYVSRFTFSCSSYSSIYFIGTGFHGLHVLIGTVLLSICLFRFSSILISPNHRAGFECSVWYWHFVDVVWFFLYLVFYWWGV